MPTDGRRDTDAQRNGEVTRFVEQFAMVFNDLGFPRMPARVLAALLSAEGPGLTAGELGERLGVSPAAVSGAVRYLMQVGLVVREPVAGSRRDIYHMPDDSWYGWYRNTIGNGTYRRLVDVVQQGVLAVDDDSRASARLSEMRDFFLFIQDELTEALKRWEKSRQQAAGG